MQVNAAIAGSVATRIKSFDVAPLTSYRFSEVPSRQAWF